MPDPIEKSASPERRDAPIATVPENKSAIVASTGRRGETVERSEPRNGDETRTVVPSANGQTQTVGADESVHDEVIPEVAGYKILEAVGHGGMGIVYRAYQKSLDRVVALKMILSGAHARPRELQRFQAEAKNIARLKHQNIVQIYEVGEAGGLPYIALEFVSGGTLAHKIARDPQPPRYAAKIVEALARAVHYAHEQGVVHRDLKPANILLDERGTPKITDFGVAKSLENESGATQTGQVLGTPSYMAPEQAAGAANRVGPTVDVYALGATLYDLLTGRPPFAGSSVLDTLELVRTREPVPPGQLAGNVPRDLETIALKCLQKDPARRYESAGLLADDLRRFLDGKPIVARPVGSVERTWRWARRNPWIASLGTAVAILLFTVAIVTSILSYRLSIQKRDAERARDQEAIAKEKAVEEQQKAEKARDAEAKARRLTIEQRELALNTVRDVLLRVDELMKNDAKLFPVRVEIIRRMIEDVDRIRDHANKNPLEDRTEALAFARIGEIYFIANRIKDAHESYSKAYVKFKGLAEQAGDDPNAIRNLAGVTHSLADAEWRLGDGKKARELHATGLVLRQKRYQLVEAAGEMEREAALADVAESFNHIAYADLRLGEPELAERNYREAIKTYNSLNVAVKTQLKTQRILSEVEVRLGDAIFRQKRQDEAQQHYVKALTDRRERVDRMPIRLNSRQFLECDVGQSRMYLGDFFLFARRDPVTADLHYRLALEIFDSLLKNDPDNLDFRQRSAATHYRLGMTAGRRPDVAMLMGAAADAAPKTAHFESSLKLREALASIDTTDAERQVELLLSQARLGRINDARITVDRLLRQAPTDRQVLFQTACGLAILGGGTDETARRYRDEAFKVLTALMDNGWKDPVALQTDPDFDAIRSDKRFAELFVRVAVDE